MPGRGGTPCASLIPTGNMGGFQHSHMEFLGMGSRGGAVGARGPVLVVAPDGLPGPGPVPGWGLARGKPERGNQLNNPPCARRDCGQCASLFPKFCLLSL